MEKLELPLSESEIFSQMRSGEVRYPPLEITTAPSPRGAADALVQVRWQSETYSFAAEFKGRGTPQVLAQSISQARTTAERLGVHPLVVVPYLSPERVSELERAQVSGIDLCGNACIIVPGKLLVLRTGAPNRFRESFSIRDVYRGNTSLVARSLLLRPRSDSLADLRRFIQERAGSITLTTISKALRRLEDDVLIERRGGRARLLQPDALMDKLAAGYRSPKVRRRFIGSTPLDTNTLAARLANTPTRLILTGRSSTSQYAVMGREQRLSLYSESNATLLHALGGDVREGERFANLELLETDDPTVYFDARRSKLPLASPIQTYLELASGDKREQETAQQVRTFILNELRKETDTP